ncbi:MAG: hypothetical protein ABSH50_21920 [Bryobacteraceae bacterium]|jgi:hypothetical protein
MKLVTGLVILCGCAFGQDRAAVSSAETAACGSRDVRMEVKIDASQHPTPPPSDGKALVYFVGQDVHTRIGIDGNWVGANDRDTYFSVTVDPGDHHVCVLAQYSTASWLSLHSLQAKAGETYYFLPMPISNGGRGGTVSLEQLDPDEGRYLVAKAKFGTAHPR